MPHIIVEYSSNLDNSMDVQGLLNALHQAMIEVRRMRHCRASAPAQRAASIIASPIAIRRMPSCISSSACARAARRKRTRRSARMIMAAAEKSLERTLEQHPMQLGARKCTRSPSSPSAATPFAQVREGRMSTTLDATLARADGLSRPLPQRRRARI